MRPLLSKTAKSISGNFDLARSTRGNAAQIKFEIAHSQTTQTLVNTAAIISHTDSQGCRDQPRHMGKFFWPAALLTTLLSGCIVVPLSDRNTGNPRTDLDQPTANQIEPGFTTIEDVM
jgi:hypothetical protein